MWLSRHPPLAPMSPFLTHTRHPRIGEGPSTCRTGSTPDLPSCSSGLFSFPIARVAAGPCPGPLGLCARPENTYYVFLQNARSTIFF
jgi:hypothetical protein